MTKKVKAEFKITGQRIRFDVQGIGEFEYQCQVCDSNLFHSGDDRTVLYCTACKVVFADKRVEPKHESPENVMEVELSYEDGKVVSFPVICNCGHGGWMKATDGSSICCGKCLWIVAKPTAVGAFAQKEGINWAI
jgi:ribosomal protein L37AE/L43A